MEYYKILTPEVLEGEAWKTIEGFEGFYEVSSLGRVRSLPRVVKGNHNSTQFRKGKILKQKIKKNGYLYVCLAKESVNTYHHIHRLVAKAFIPNPDNLPQINHKDECKTNNVVGNLEWCSQLYNNNYSNKIERGIATKIARGYAYEPENREAMTKKKRHLYYLNVTKNDPIAKERNRQAVRRYRQRKKERVLGN